MDYTSEVTKEAASAEGVRYTIVRMSFGRRLELTRRIWELARRVEYLEAGGEAREKLEAAVLAGEIDRVYLEWGLVRVEGLNIDGQPATAATLVEHGPEALAREIVGAIKSECGLSEDERKN
ncbi:MAG: hypothetical protein ACM3ZB_02115 [bacterium]|jgi:hypothetical protein